MLLLAGCDKRTPEFYTVQGDTITFNLSAADPSDGGKQSFNGVDRRVYFTTGDQMYVNGVVSDVHPRPTAAFLGSSASYSPLAHVSAAVARNGIYRFVYPASDVEIAGSGYRAVFPRKVDALKDDYADNDFSGMGDSVYAAPVWPMYFGTSDLSREEGIAMKNTCAFLSPSITYGPAWANAVFRRISTGGSYGMQWDSTYRPAPDLAMVRGAIISDLVPLSGSAHLNAVNPDEPFMVMDRGAFSTSVVFRCPAGSVCVDNVVPGNENVANCAGIIPTATISNNSSKGFMLAMCLDAEIEGETFYLLYVSSVKYTTSPIERNRRYNMNINLRDVEMHDYEDGMLYFAKVYSSKGSRVVFGTKEGGPTSSVVVFAKERDRDNAWDIFVNGNYTAEPL